MLLAATAPPPRPQDLPALLAAEGVDTSLSPVLLAAAANDPTAYENLLPLAAFDNNDFEIRSPTQWLELIQQARTGETQQIGPPCLVAVGWWLVALPLACIDFSGRVIYALLTNCLFRVCHCTGRHCLCLRSDSMSMRTTACDHVLCPCLL